MKIGILVTGHIAEALQPVHGEYDAMFSRFLAGHGFTFEAWFVVDGEFPPGSDAADGWLITGSRHGVYEDHAWIDPLEGLILDIIESARPLVGICFGHQIIAQALGGQVEKFAGGWSVGRTTYDTPEGPLVLNAWHQDQVTRLPEGAKVLARSDFCAYAALAYGDTVLTYQPHPEFDTRYTGDLIDARGRGVVPDPLLDAAQQGLAHGTDGGRVASRIARFFKTAEVLA